jgi:hypothetical protein
MTLRTIASGAAAALPFAGIVLAIANWNARPDSAWAWTAALVMCVVMVIARQFVRRAVRTSQGTAWPARDVASVNTAVVFASLMIVIPLAMTLAHSYGLAAGPDSGKRVTMSLIGAYIALLGNAMPTRLAPASVLLTNGARNQTFQRLAGWTWVLCGLGYALSWLVLPIDLAAPASTATVVIAMIVSLVLLVRLRKRRQQAPGLN